MNLRKYRSPEIRMKRDVVVIILLSLLYLGVAIAFTQLFLPLPQGNVTVLSSSSSPPPRPIATLRAKKPKRKKTKAEIIQQKKNDELSWATKEGRIDDVEKLLAQGAQVNGLSSTGRRPLCQAVEWASHASKSIDCEGEEPDESVPLIKLLLARGANPNLKNKHWDYESDRLGPDEQSPLNIALGGGHEGHPRFVIVKALLDAGADANEKFAGGYTPYLGSHTHSDASSKVAMRRRLLLVR